MNRESPTDIVAESIRHTLAIHPWGPDLPYHFGEYAERMKHEVAELALKALRESLTITTAEELAALPLDAVVVDTAGIPRTKRHGDSHMSAGWTHAGRSPLRSGELADGRPMRVVWHPDWRETPMSFEARYPAHYPLCGDRIEPGDQVTYADDELVHVACESEPAREDDPDEVCPDCNLIHNGGCF